MAVALLAATAVKPGGSGPGSWRQEPRPRRQPERRLREGRLCTGAGLPRPLSPELSRLIVVVFDAAGARAFGCALVFGGQPSNFRQPDTVQIGISMLTSWVILLPTYPS